MSAQNQHYVPRFILRNFLFDREKEQVAVYDKHDDRIFQTSIKNIMAEREFHDFSFEEFIVSFESVISRIEDAVLPVYNKVVAERRLTNTPEEKALLAFLIAFQFVRTKSHRDLAKGLEEDLAKHLESMGQSIENIEGWKPSTENDEKQGHLRDIRKNVGEFAKMIALKDFLLSKPSEGRSFYLGDTPVCLSNQRDFGPYGNIGLMVPGIEIYLPLASDLMLCAWCPTVLAGFREALAAHQRMPLAEVLAGRMPAAEMKAFLDRTRPRVQPLERLLKHANEGTPLDSSPDNMDYYNSLQMRCAARYVISADGDFDLAQRHNKEFPHLRRGYRPTIS